MKRHVNSFICTKENKYGCGSIALTVISELKMNRTIN
jgi:hypothetical protein